MDVVVQAVIWLNAVANALGRLALAPVALLPGWLSATIVGAVSGVVFLAVFKYTSRQSAIKRVKDDIKANLLAVKLFKDNVRVTLASQVGVFYGALRLAVFGIVPMVVMMVPALLILGQIALWYQARPLRIGEDTVVTVKLNKGQDAAWPNVQLKTAGAAQIDTGPVHVLSQNELCWRITARENGYHRLVFDVADQSVDKEFAVGDGFMRVSTQRPKWDWWDILLNPEEAPFGPDSPVQAIEIEYPTRSSWTSGTDTWVIYWFVVSMIAALCFRRALNVNF